MPADDHSLKFALMQAASISAAQADALVAAISTTGGSSAILPSSEATDRALTDADLGKNLVTSGGSRVYTVNVGRVAGFNVSFTGQMSLSAGSTATWTDDRVAGYVGTPYASLVPVGTDSYSLRGVKP